MMVFVLGVRFVDACTSILTCLSPLTDQHQQNDDQLSAEALRQAEVRGKEIIARIPDAVREAIRSRTMECKVGEFHQHEVTPGRGDFYPDRTQLSGAAVHVYDYCQKEGLHLFVGGEYKMATRMHVAPFDIYIRMTRC